VEAAARRALMGAEGMGRQGAHPFGGNEAWSEIYTRLLSPLPISSSSPRERKRSRWRRKGQVRERAAPPSQTTFPSKTKRLPDLSLSISS